MDNKIDKLISLCGTYNKYQFILLLISFLCWTNFMLISFTLPYLEDTPTITYHSTVLKKNVTNNFNYEHCNIKNYTILSDIGYSIIMDTGVHCSKIKTGIYGTSTFLGTLIGSLIFHFIVDKIGRINTFIYFAISYIIFNTSIIFFSNYYLILIFTLLQSICCPIPPYTSLILLLEITKKEYRGIFGTIVNAGVPFTGILFFPCFKFFDNWRITFGINSFIALICLILFFLFVYESPRFIISKGNIDEALIVLKKISEFHKITDFDDNIKKDEYKNIISEIKNKFNKETNSEFNHHKDNIKWYYLLKFPSLRYKFLILCFLGFCISGSYTGISISVKHLPGDIFRNTMLFNIFEVFVGFLSGFLITTKLLGRKGTILLFYFIATISFLIILLHNLKEFEKIILILFLKFSIMGIFCIIYTYFIENYPTSIREIGFGINSGMDNIGGSLFPIITEVLKTRELYVILAILNIIEFTLMWFMPETNGIPLPETIKEIEEINEKEIDLSNKLIIFEKDSTQLEDEKMNLINSEK